MHGFTRLIVFPAVAALAGAALVACSSEAGTACSQLADASFDGFSITSAKDIAQTDSVPAHCEVTAQIPPKADGWPINLQVDMPADWSGRAVQFGGGGFDGVIPEPEFPWSTPGAMERFMQQHNATFSGDSGHDAKNLPVGPEYDTRGGSFALKAEALENFGNASERKTYNAAMQIIVAHYGSKPKWTYFVGFSQGGKEAMQGAQKHGEDYDGMLIGDPALNLTGLMLLHHKVTQDFYANGGENWINPTLARKAADLSVAQCDELDGLKDGWIGNFEACKPDFSELVCGDETSAECLTPGQLAALNGIAEPFTLDYQLPSGLSSHAGYSWGHIDLSGAYIGARQQPSLPVANQGGVRDAFVYALGDGYVRFFVAGDEKYATLDFDPNAPQWRDRIMELSSIIDATNPDLSKLADHGGKMILYAGGSSEVPPLETAAFYNRVVRTMGEQKADDFIRYYVFPNVTHFGSKPDGLPGAADLFPVLQAWVEQGKAPGHLVNTSQDSTKVAERPLCAYPAWPRYNGAGDTSSSESFTCVTD
ncbi:MAG: tannase/feruloyl esterase family alpha/beta hydrolase [Gammaproteobacteria bacterium]|nr:tannase/feruloyl esterase family alpha/beta hydrolase [Gammaproteobacteria bacterium]